MIKSIYYSCRGQRPWRVLAIKCIYNTHKIMIITLTITMIKATIILSIKSALTSLPFEADIYHYAQNK